MTGGQKRKYLRGFTLVELLVVISIISLLSSVVFASVNSARAKARVAKAAAELRQLSTVLNLYLDAQGVYPCFDHAWDDAKEKVWSAAYISAWPKSPWSNVYHWEHDFGTGLRFSISIRGVPDAEAQALDKAIDDNNMSTGILRSGAISEAGRIEYGGMDQTVPFVDCHI